jgi:hypothetical protein
MMSFSVAILGALKVAMERVKLLTRMATNTVEIGQITVHGAGEMKFSNGDLYWGEFADSKAHGVGVLRFVNGDEYEGPFVDGCCNGQGVLRKLSGYIYDGHWIDNIDSGEACVKYADNSTYQGIFLNGKRHGLRLFNDGVYDGHLSTIKLMALDGTLIILTLPTMEYLSLGKGQAKEK